MRSAMGIADRPEIKSNWNRLNSLEILAERHIFPAKVLEKSTKDRFQFHCPLPGHEDSKLKFSIHADGFRWKCWICGGGGPHALISLLDGDSAPPRQSNTAPEIIGKPRSYGKPAGCNLARLAELKGLDVEHLRALGWTDSTWFGTPAVQIPYPEGIRYRVALEGSNRFRWAKGSEAGLLGLDRLPQVGTVILVVEGETDYAQATGAGIPAIGVPGATIFKRKWLTPLEGYPLVLWREPDEAGNKMAEKWVEERPDIRVIEAPIAIKDVCELAKQCGSGFRDALQELIDESTDARSPISDYPTFRQGYSFVEKSVGVSPVLPIGFLAIRKERLVDLLLCCGRSEEAATARVCGFYRVEECHNCLEVQANRRYSCNLRGCTRDVSVDLNRAFNKKRAGLPLLKEPVVLEIRTEKHPLECSAAAIRRSLVELRNGINAFKARRGFNGLYALGLSLVAQDSASRNMVLLTEDRDGLVEDLQKWFSRRLGIPVEIERHDFPDHSPEDRLALSEGYFKTLVLRSLPEWADVECYEAWEQAVKGFHTIQALGCLYAIKDSCRRTDEVTERGADNVEHPETCHRVERREAFSCRACGDKSGLFQTGRLIDPDLTELVYSEITRRYYRRLVDSDADSIPVPQGITHRW